ncbi:hypothetical protein Pelo_17976 [Pelomyxa schiedti]|nr:hypothetical protein Pelo_17976 [Pelomyxa schiedti]
MTATERHKEIEKQHITRMARIVWDQVVVPWVLRPAAARHKVGGRGLPRAAASCVLATAEALFPLVALACRAVSRSPPGPGGSHHRAAVEAAAASLCPRCVAWMISRRGAPGGGGGGGGVEGGERGSGSGGGGGGSRRRRAKEQVAVLAGLCGAGHLRAAQMFVENGCEGWPPLVESEPRLGLEEGGAGGPLGKIPPLWPEIEMEAEVFTCLFLAITKSYPKKLIKKFTWHLRSGLEEGTYLCDELWSEKGISHIVGQVCSNGHLDALEWILCSVFPLDDGPNNKLLEGCLTEASRNGHLHIIKWLVDTFGLDDDTSISSVLELKNGVSGVKSFVRSFPHWKMVMAKSVPMARGASADEIVEVCKWLSNNFSIPEVKFLSKFWLPKHATVIKWALSGCNHTKKLWNWWNLSCRVCGDVQLGKWFVEEKGVVPRAEDFVMACAGKHDNVVFVEWLFKQEASPMSNDDLILSLHWALAEQNELTAQWLEKYFFTSRRTKPKVSLSLFFRCYISCREGWLEWLFTHHSGTCDIDCSQSDVVTAVQESIATPCPEYLNFIFAVLKKFPLNPSVHHDLLLSLLKEAMEFQELACLKELLSIAEFSQSEMEECLNFLSYNQHSSKFAKWLTMYTCGTTQGSVPTIIRILIGLIAKNKRGCAEWLVNLFDPPLSLVLGEAHQLVSHDISLATWKMMLRLFPDINREVTIQSFGFMKIVVATPLHARLTMDRLGLTVEDLDDFSELRRGDSESIAGDLDDY